MEYNRDPPDTKFFQFFVRFGDPSSSIQTWGKASLASYRCSHVFRSLPILRIQVMTRRTLGKFLRSSSDFLLMEVPSNKDHNRAFWGGDLALQLVCLYGTIFFPPWEGFLLWGGAAVRRDVEKMCFLKRGVLWWCALRRGILKGVYGAEMCLEGRS